MSLKGKSIEVKVRDKYGVEIEPLLFDWYWNEGLDQKQIAKRLDVSTGCISLNFKKFGIKKRPHSSWNIGRKVSPEVIEKIKATHTGKIVSEETRKKMSEARKGFKLVGNYPSFPGKRHRGDGYIQIFIPDHPFASSEGYYMEHRYLMEQEIGRYLTPEEEIHHINHVRSDNRIENLHLFASKKDHMRFHMSERHGNKEELKYEYQ